MNLRFCNVVKGYSLWLSVTIIKYCWIYQSFDKLSTISVVAQSLFTNFCPQSTPAWFGYFRLFIVATGCPSEQCPQKTLSYYRVIVQGYRMKLLRAPPGALTLSHTSPGFYVSAVHLF